MKRYLRWAMAVAFGLSVGCTSANSPVPVAGGDSLPTVDVAPSSPGAPGLTGDVAFHPTGATKFDSVQEVEVVAHVSNLTSSGELVAEFRSPRGAAYSAQAADVTPDNASAQFKLPVAGTMLAQGGLAGVWKAHFTLNGQDLGDVSFVLEQ